MSNPSSSAATQCPRCRKGDGQPFRLARDVDAAAVRVLLRCDQCQHRWSTIAAADDGLVTNNAQLWATK
jgi:transcriptional regulator NrdR family protein